MPSKTSRRNASKARQAAQGTQVRQVHQTDQVQAKDQTTMAAMSYRIARMPLKSENSAETLVEEDMQSPKAGMSPLPNHHDHDQAVNNASSKRSRKTARAARVTARNQAPLSEDCWEHNKHSKTGAIDLHSSQSLETLVEKEDDNLLEPLSHDAPRKICLVPEVVSTASQPEPDSDGQKLPAEVLGICGKYLADDKCYRSLSSLNVASRSVNYATEPVAKHTIRVNIDPTRRYITFSKFLQAIALEYPNLYRHIRFAFSAPQQITLSPRDAMTVRTGKGCAEIAPHTTVLFRLKTDDPLDCQTVMRVSKDYQPFSEESHRFIREHGNIDYLPADPRQSRTRSNTLIVLAPSSASDMTQVSNTRKEFDRLERFQFCPDSQDKTVKLLKASEEPFDADYLHLLMIDLMVLCGRYKERSGRRPRPKLILEGLSDEESAIATKALKAAIRLEKRHESHDRPCRKIQFQNNGSRVGLDVLDPFLPRAAR